MRKSLSCGEVPENEAFMSQAQLLHVEGKTQYMLDINFKKGEYLVIHRAN